MTLDLDTLTLDRSSHTTPDDGVCLMEAVSLFAGEPFSDHPKCASPVLTDFGISLNDRWDDAARQKLIPLIPLIVGTRDDQDEARGYLALDWLIRTYTPAWLDLAGLTVEAAGLRSLPRIVDLAAVESAGPVVRQAQKKAAAAAGAARDGAAVGAAVEAAVRDATRAAVGDAALAAAGAARDAAGDAAGAAARYATRYAVRDATRAAVGAAVGAATPDATRTAVLAAARDVLEPTVVMLQDSAVELFRAMTNPRAVNA